MSTTNHCCRTETTPWAEFVHLRRWLPALVVLSLQVCVTSARGEVRWDGAGDPQQAGLVVHGDAAAVRFDTDASGAQPGVLRIDTTASPATMGRVELSPESAAAELNAERGWTVEVQVRLGTHASQKPEWHDWYGVHVLVADDRTQFTFAFRNDKSDVAPHGFLAVITPTSSGDPGATDAPLGEGFNTLQIVRPGGAAHANVYLNGVLVERAAGNPLEAGAVPRLSFGDGSSNSSGSADWDALLVNAPTSDAVPDPAALAFFETDVRPLLAQHCQSCHGDEKQEGNLRLDSLAGVLAGGDSGAAIVAGQPAESLLISAVRRTGPEMPPTEHLSAEQIATLEKWIELGAPWPKLSARLERQANSNVRPLFSALEQTHWSFQPPRVPSRPAINDVHWLQQDVDNFVLAKLEQHGLSPAPPAGKATLLRRVTYDLTGLPPTTEELTAFLSDESPSAYATVVDRLLNSPHYGEQQGRRWLDVVRYSDCLGGGGNLPFANAHRYRDYVIAAFNKDKPFDRFIQEQIAGDLLPAGDAETEYDRMTGPGVLLLGPSSSMTRLDLAAEQIAMLTRAFLGMNMACARCHDHPYEPLPTEDFYSLAGIFTSTHSINDGSGNQSGQPDKWFERDIQSPAGEMVKVLSVEEGTVENLRVHHRGQTDQLRDEAPRRMPRILAGEDQQVLASTSSGRLELAEWITRDNHPLAARVIVNRIWQQHFGVGIVPDPDNFGLSAQQGPTHPELLDWLAVEFVRSGWSIKALHRTILLSSTYQMSWRDDPASGAIDPENQWLWRQNRRRLEAEEIRDSLLAASGQLETRPGGSLFADLGLTNKDDLTDKGRLYLVMDRFGTIRQRSVYLPVIRGEMHMAELLDTFDFPGRYETAGRRSSSTTAPQALLLMNAPFVLEQVAAITQQLLQHEPADETARVRLMYETLLSRRPDEAETAAALDFVRSWPIEDAAAAGPDEPWRNLVHALCQTNEYVYID